MECASILDAIVVFGSLGHLRLTRGKARLHVAVVSILTNAKAAGVTEDIFEKLVHAWLWAGICKLNTVLDKLVDLQHSAD